MEVIIYCSRWLMNSSDAYSRRSDVLEMKIAAALGRLNAEAIPRGDFGLAPLSAKMFKKNLYEYIYCVAGKLR